MMDQVCWWMCNNIKYNVQCTIDPTIHYDSEFGVGNGPIIWSSVYCNGWEASIHDCTKTVLPDFNCYSSYIAGVTCKEGNTN